MNSKRFENAAQTVVHLGAFLKELQERTVTYDLQGISQRGYLTPAEETRLRQLQHSYWQSRNALLELVDSLRSDEAINEEDYPIPFLIGYGAAVLLVDTARFLREMFHRNKVLRKKLNEPDELSGVPAGMYSTIQKSLVNRSNAWHLWQARQYFTGHEEMLCELKNNPLLAQVLEIIDQLGDRLRPSIPLFLKTRLKVGGRRLARQVGPNGFGRAFYSLQRGFSKMVTDVYLQHGHRPNLPAEVCQQIVDQLLPGDVIVVRKEYAATNYFLPGYWPHAALYVGRSDELMTLGVLEADQNDPAVKRSLGEVCRLQVAGESPPQPPWNGQTVLEALKDGVRIRPLSSALAADSIVVLRPNLSKKGVAQALVAGMRHESKPYDFNFDFTRSDRMVCTEVVYRALEGVEGIDFPLPRHMGRFALAASDLIQLALASNHFELLLVYSPKHSQTIEHGAAAIAIVSQELSL